MNGISAFVKESSESSLAPSTKWGHSKKTTITSSNQTLNLLVPCSWISQLSELWKINLLFISNPVYGIFLWKPKQIETMLNVLHDWLKSTNQQPRFVNTIHLNLWKEGVLTKLDRVHCSSAWRQMYESIIFLKFFIFWHFIFPLQLKNKNKGISTNRSTDYKQYSKDFSECVAATERHENHVCLVFLCPVLLTIQN